MPSPEKAQTVSRWALFVAVIVALVAPQGCARKHPGPPIRVGSVAGDQQRLLAEITLLLLDAHDYGIERCPASETPGVARSGLTDGSIDLWWQYTGDTWSVDLEHDQPIVDADELFRRVCLEDAQRGIAWIGPAPAERPLTLIVSKELAGRSALRSLSDLAVYEATVDPYLRLCSPESMQGSAAGVQGLERVYGLRFRRDLRVDLALEEGYAALRDGLCDCALGYAIDPRVEQYGLLALEDDRSFFPASNLAIGVRTEVLEAYPELEEILGRLAVQVTGPELAGMRAQLELGEADIRGVARSFLRRHDLLYGP